MNTNLNGIKCAIPIPKLNMVKIMRPDTIAGLVVLIAEESYLTVDLDEIAINHAASSKEGMVIDASDKVAIGVEVPYVHKSTLHLETSAPPA